jgi:hypothetical protein
MVLQSSDGFPKFFRTLDQTIEKLDPGDDPRHGNQDHAPNAGFTAEKALFNKERRLRRMEK